MEIVKQRLTSVFRRSFKIGEISSPFAGCGPHTEEGSLIMTHVCATGCPDVLEVRFISAPGIENLVIFFSDLINVLILLPHHGLIQVKGGDQSGVEGTRLVLTWPIPEEVLVRRWSAHTCHRNVACSVYL